MVITKEAKYNREYKQLKKQNKINELERIDKIENLLISSANFAEVMLSPYKNIYVIEKKKGNLKLFYTAHINRKLRLVMKPVGTYPYNNIEITEIEFIDIDTHHYGEG